MWGAKLIQRFNTRDEVQSLRIHGAEDLGSEANSLLKKFPSKLNKHIQIPHESKAVFKL